MKVYALVYRGEFNCECYDNVYLYSTFDKAYESFVEIIKDWFDNEDKFNVPIPTENIEWHNDEYTGHYTKTNNSVYLYIEETFNVVNHLSMCIEENTLYNVNVRN